MADSQRALLDKLAVRVAARTGLDLDAARLAVDDALVQRGEYLLVVRAEATAMAEEMAQPIKAVYRSFSEAVRRVCAAAAAGPAATDRAPAPDASAVAEARAGIRDHERGLRMAAHHPDLAALDRLLDALYEQPDA
jgi:hypothetical protein